MSTILLSVLLLGILSPTGMCALMCERHSRAEAHHHCSEDSDSMPGMAHHQPVMHHPGVRDVTHVMQAQSCQTDCAKVGRLNIPGKVVPQVTVVQTGAVVLDRTSKFLAPHLESEWSLDSGPPSIPSPYAASYSILRI